MKRTVPLPQSFGSCKVPLLLAVAAMTGHWGLRHRVENGGRWNISVLLSIHSILFRSGGQTWGLLLELSLSAPSAHCQCVEFRPGYPRRKRNGKLTVGLVVFRILVSSTLPDTVYFSESLENCSLHSVQLHSTRDMVIAVYYHLTLVWNFLLHSLNSLPSSRCYCLVSVI